MPPSKDVSGITEELAWFERIRKFLADKKTYNEFLKLCNLFSQELIDKNLLMHHAHSFIGANVELTNWFKNFIEYDGRDEVIVNRPRIPGDKVVLSNCRGLGPSYRLLPKRERLRSCGGRDEFCKSVLNDEWVSHPTWASEDSGFIAHRKNIHEEALHRIEEERHDYDINIEACSRTIQLIEPIVQQLNMLPEAERLTFILPPGLGGQSETIYQRVIKKLYDRERGSEVIDRMFRHPYACLPVLLKRLNQKIEEWKAAQVSCSLLKIRMIVNVCCRENGRRSGESRRIRSSIRVSTINGSRQRKKTSANSSQKPCRPKFKSSMKNSDDNVLPRVVEHQSFSSNTTLETPVLFVMHATSS